jgi:hypothetical protein
MKHCALTFVSIAKRPSAFLPMAMSLIALALVLGHVGSDLVQNGHVLGEADEGTDAHLWQLLMAGQLPVLAFFAMRWLPRAPRQTLEVLPCKLGQCSQILPLSFFRGSARFHRSKESRLGAHAIRSHQNRAT